MSVTRMHQRRPYPNFYLNKIPESERDEAGSIRINIGDLHNRATNYWSAKTLFDHLDFRKNTEPHHGMTFYNWQLCAARDCVMSIYHFGRIIEGIDDSIANCKSILQFIDATEKRKARKRFERQFPFYIDLRHAIAHSAERSHTHQDALCHGAAPKNRKITLSPDISINISEDSSILLVGDYISGSKFSSMWKSALVSLDITDDNGSFLDRIIDDYWSVFSGIIDPNPEPPPTVTVSSQPSL